MILLDYNYLFNYNKNKKFFYIFNDYYLHNSPVLKIHPGVKIT